MEVAMAAAVVMVRVVQMALVPVLPLLLVVVVAVVVVTRRCPPPQRQAATPTRLPPPPRLPECRNRDPDG